VLNSVITRPSQTLAPLNDSYIVLVPKKEDVSKPSDFRPISLVNSVQKIFSKIIANRMQTHISSFLTETWMGFVKGRNILHGFLYAQEVIGFVSKQKQHIMVFKANIHKAFDSIEWPFIFQCPRALGFPEILIDWIEFLILQGTSKVILNSVAGRNIVLKRGVRQGDPMSPFIFNIAIDFLARWIVRLSQL
jgi:Reverse transcriptase (RNA-dependent DNA polymerase)